jgi:glutaredoxin-like protein
MKGQMLDENIRKQVKELFADCVEPVEILFFGSEDREACPYCDDTSQLLGEVTSLSDKMTLQVLDIDQDAELARQYHVDGVPSFVIAGRQGEELIDFGVRYKGIPAGHEFSSLVNDLVLVSKRDSGLSAEVREYLNGLQEPVHLQVFVTPT